MRSIRATLKVVGKVRSSGEGCGDTQKGLMSQGRNMETGWHDVGEVIGTGGVIGVAWNVRERWGVSGEGWV